MSVVGGGVENASTDIAINVNMSAPFDDDDPDLIPDDGWSAYLNNTNDTGDLVFFRVVAICTSATSIG